jgi:ABC-type nitrate/sulfonate/bicarbonate transport system substrate-binding protein
MTRDRLVIGFVPLLDCAPLVVAAEKGFAAAENLDLELVRESSWANIRDRVIVGQFDAAHMLGPMPIASTLGIGHLRVPMIAPMALGLGGNAITVSASLWATMQHHGASIGADPTIQGAALKSVVRERARAGAAPLTLAMVYPFSSHNYELRYWLTACGIDPDDDVLLIVIPPPFMVDALRSGQIDGFCSGEPWNSLAVAAEIGRIVTGTAAIWRQSPEKVIGMRTDWADTHRAETAALVRAVYHASVWCDRPESHAELAQLLAQPRFVGESPDVIERGISGRLMHAPAAAPLEVPEFLQYSSHHATFPWTSHALWFYTQMVRWKQLSASEGAAAAARATYRPDIYRQSLQPLGLSLPLSDNKVERTAGTGAGATGFFDGKTFDPDDIRGYLEP